MPDLPIGAVISTKRSRAPYVPAVISRARVTVEVADQQTCLSHLLIQCGDASIRGRTYPHPKYVVEALMNQGQIVGWDMQGSDGIQRFVVDEDGRLQPRDKLGVEIKVGNTHRPVFELATPEDPSVTTLAFLLAPEIDLYKSFERTYLPIMLCGVEIASSTIVGPNEYVRRIAVHFGRSQKHCLSGYTTLGGFSVLSAISVGGIIGWRGESGTFRLSDEGHLVPWALSGDDKHKIRQLSSIGRPIFADIGQYGEATGNPIGPVLFWLGSKVPIE